MPRIPISTMARIRRDRWEQAASERFGRAKAKETRANVLHCRCRTWIASEMAKDSQIAESAAILKPEEGDTPLVAGLLHPMHLRSAPAPATAAA
jgi:hypothetical protein